MTKLDRRQFVLSATASFGAATILGGCGPGPDGNEPEPDPEPDTEPEPEIPTGPGPEPDAVWEAPGAETAALFGFGVQVGDVLPASAIVSVQTTASEVDVVLAVATDEGWQEQARLDAVSVTDGAVQVDVVDLWPDFTWAVAVYDAGSTEDRAAVSRFRTPPNTDVARTVRFAATSCLGGNRPWANISAVAAERPDFAVLLGDTVYADETADDGFAGLWEGALSQSGLRDLSASTSLVCTWDDHEVDNNWSFETAGIEQRFAIAREAFRRYLPQRAGDNDTIWRKLSWGSAVDSFVLDCRGERRDGNYISPEQMDWLKSGLSASTARFKIILNTVPIIDFSDLPFGAGSISAEDRWQGFPAQRGELLSHIVEEEIPGVLFVAGDFHIGGWAKVDVAGGVAAELSEVLVGPAGSPINPASGLVSENARYGGVVGEHNSVLFECDPDAGTIAVRFYDDAGAVIRETTFEL